MPDARETAHCLERQSPADGNAATLSKIGYANLEMYPNEPAGDLNRAHPTGAAAVRLAHTA